MDIFIAYILFNFIVEIIINAVILNIIYLYSEMDQYTYFKNVFIYAVCKGVFEQLKMFIVIHKISIQTLVSTFGIYCIVALIVVFAINKLSSRFGKTSIIIIATILDIIMQLILTQLLSFNLFI